MKLNFKWLTVPFTNDTKDVEAFQLWEVRWTSRHGGYHGDTRPEVEAFPSQEAAEEFATSLRNAIRLLRHTSDVFNRTETQVTVSKG